MNFVFGFDEGFAMPTGVALRSLDRFLTSKDQIFLLHDAVPIRAMRSVCACASQAQLIDVDCSAMFERSWAPPGHVTRAAFLRFLAPSLLRSEARCVYLDGDVIVRRNPSELHSHDLGGTTLGAVRSRVTPFAASHGGIMRWRDLGIPSTAPYFNSGVLVMDLERWRDRRITERITEFLAKHRAHTYLADQEALNVAVAGDWAPLDRSWNYVTHVAEGFLQLPECEPTNPHIAHFAGRSKPWSYGLQPIYTEEWFALLTETPWAGFKPTAPALPTGPKAWAKRNAGRLIRRVRDLTRE